MARYLENKETKLRSNPSASRNMFAQSYPFIWYHIAARKLVKKY